MTILLARADARALPLRGGLEFFSENPREVNGSLEGLGVASRHYDALVLDKLSSLWRNSDTFPSCPYQCFQASLPNHAVRVYPTVASFAEREKIAFGMVRLVVVDVMNGKWIPKSSFLDATETAGVVITVTDGPLECTTKTGCILALADATTPSWIFFSTDRLCNTPSPFRIFRVFQTTLSRICASFWCPPSQPFGLGICGNFASQKPWAWSLPLNLAHSSAMRWCSWIGTGAGATELRDRCLGLSALRTRIFSYGHESSIAVQHGTTKRTTNVQVELF
jgi:hypothetical protein